MSMLQSGQAIQNFKSMRTICKEIGKGNTIQYISQKDFFALDHSQHTRLIERPLVIAADPSYKKESLYVQNHAHLSNINSDQFASPTQPSIDDDDDDCHMINDDRNQ